MNFQREQGKENLKIISFLTCSVGTFGDEDFPNSKQINMLYANN